MTGLAIHFNLRYLRRICARKSAMRICPTHWSYDSPMIPLPRPPNRPIVRSFCMNRDMNRATLDLNSQIGLQFDLS
jgi:hypothetical protein